jgi:hypothetical protein
MRRLLIAGLLGLASCAPSPAALLQTLQEGAALAKAANTQRASACPKGQELAPHCIVLSLCLDQVAKVGHECSGAIVTGATAASDEYSKAARRCTDAGSVSSFVCRAADVRIEGPHGIR